MDDFLRTSANIFEFYKSTLVIAVAVSVFGSLFGGFEMFKVMLIFFGFWISILMKEVNAKNEYLFYYNNGISKLKLLVLSFIMNIVFSILFIFIYNLIRNWYD